MPTSICIGVSHLTFSALTMFTADGIGNHGKLSIKHGLYMAYLLIIWRTSSISQSVAGVLRICPNCGNTSVPYPFSTEDGCGVPDYRLYCNAEEKLEFRGINGMSYKVVTIDPPAMRFVVEPARMFSDSCDTEDMKNQGMQLNESLPFNLTSANTMMFMNCNPTMLVSPLNCSSISPCHKYIDQGGAPEVCRRGNKNTSDICCSYRTGGPTTAYSILVVHDRCRAYTSVLNFNVSLPPSEWKYGVQIQWIAPREPSCKTQADCANNSACSPDSVNPGVTDRCFCVNDTFWDPIKGICARNLSICIGDGCGNNQGKRMITGLIAGMIGMAVAIAIAVVVIIQYRTKQQKLRNEARLMKEREHILSSQSGGMSLKLFSSTEMRKATNGFAKDQVLGYGGFGEVYKGILKDGTVVAVKTAKVGNIKGIEQVLNEVRILSQVNHRSLVRLTGCCVDTEEPLLVYEYIPNGTLFDHLHTTSRGIFLDWTARLNIALQTAEALAYLHSAAFPPIYHRDIKSTNILLDHKLNAKVSDFGLSRLAETDLSHISTCAQGTLGYLDPEYYKNYQLTDKSDVYSFGVVLLELVTSQKAIDFNREPEDINLPVHVLNQGEKGRIIDVVDPRLRENASEVALDTMKAVVDLALGCLEERRQGRPTMKEVAEELQYLISIEASEVVQSQMITEVEPLF